MGRLLCLIAVLGVAIGGCAGTAQRSGMTNQQLMEEIKALQEQEQVDVLARQKIDQLQGQIKTFMEAQDKKIESLGIQSANLNNRIALLADRVGKLEEDVKKLTPQTVHVPAKPSVPEGGEQRVEAAYKAALQHYFDRRFEQAIGEFSEIIAMAPRHELADNAQYWIGEAYYGLENYHQALTEFEKVFTYPETEKADDARLKIGYCYLKLGDKTRAVAEFKRLLAEYSDSEYIHEAKRLISQLETQ